MSIPKQGNQEAHRRNSYVLEVLVLVFIVAAFGPYLTGSVRTEQVVVYSFSPLLLLSFVRVKKWALAILVFWAFALVVVTVGQIFKYKGFMPWSGGSVLGGYDNLLLPLVLMLLVWTVIPRNRTPDVLRSAARTIVLLTAVNALLAIASSINPSLVNFLQYFWGGGIDSSVAGRAMEMGRFSGIFNQPAEAGLVYSVAAVLAIWAFAKRPALMYGLIGVISIGGMLSVSKIFLLIGAPVYIVLLFKTQKMPAKLGFAFVSVFLAAFLASAAFFQEWTGLEYLTRLLNVPEGQNALQFYTAGRWAEDSALLNTASQILRASPLVGMGVGGLVVAYDSLWVEAIVLGGVLMVLAMVAVLLVLIVFFRKIQSRELRLTAYAFWVILVGSSFGIPSLTVNRAATIVWIIIALLVAVGQINNYEDLDLRRGDAIDEYSRRRGSKTQVDHSC